MNPDAPHLSREELNRRAAFILDHTGWAVAIIGSEANRIDFCNASFAEMHGWEAAELIGRSLLDTLAPEWRGQWPKHNAALAQGGDYIYESLHLRKDGTIFPCRTHATTFKADDGTTQFRASIFEDISERKRTDLALRQSEALKTGILNSGLDGIITIDHESRIIEFNAAAERLFGYVRDEILGRRMDELIVPPALREAHAKGMARYLQTGETRILGRRIEITAMRADGSEFACELAIVRIPLEGPPLFTSFVRDITERKQTQQDLASAKAALEEHARTLEKTVAERTKALQNSIAELERFSYSLSHDMRAPLRAIHSFVQIVLAEAGEKLDAPERDFLQKAINAAGRLDRLIQDVLNYSKVSRQEVDLRPVDVAKLIRQIIDERPELRPPQSEVVMEGSLEKVNGHEAFLTQCITNLLDNAVKFVAPGAQPRVRIWNEARDGRVRLWFEDNGIGIPKEAQTRMFGMFQRMHDEKTYPGTGIGLTIARKSVERMGGAMGVESEVGGGSRFWIELQRA